MTGHSPMVFSPIGESTIGEITGGPSLKQYLSAKYLVTIFLLNSNSINDLFVMKFIFKNLEPLVNLPL
jgi:hypothetical protein